MQDVGSDDRASRIGTLIGTLVVFGVMAVIAIDIVNAVGRLSGA